MWRCENKAMNHYCLQASFIHRVLVSLSWKGRRREGQGMTHEITEIWLSGISWKDNWKDIFGCRRRSWCWLEPGSGKEGMTSMKQKEPQLHSPTNWSNYTTCLKQNETKLVPKSHSRVPFHAFCYISVKRNKKLSWLLSSYPRKLWKWIRYHVLVPYAAV